MKLKRNIILALGITLLFLGVGIQPAIATVRPESIDLEYFDVTTEFIGLRQEYTTKLTKDEMGELKAYIGSTLDRLNHTTSLEEAIEIYKCAILELDKYGLLGDIGVEETEKLVLNYYQRTIILKALEKLYNRKQEPVQVKENRNCLIFGWTYNTLILTPRIFNTIEFIYNFLRFITPFNFPHYGLWIIIFLLALIWQVQPLSLGRYICYLEDSFGLVTSIGIFGYEKWIGYLEGQLQYNEANDVGVVGFTGMKIYLGLTYGSIYLGYAHHISIRDWGWFRY